ncbi:MAG: hypothetical protein A2W97_13355 [Bacteroidetes bacterium GWE2_40_63]|nr:MAG: hypothetical protein A2W84_10675 [Bacteroidetes bacterium GWC2_40_13]OFX73712.1 MAG: hypothetical protein A2W96_07750 [Bacteroidetes bacterium GWD2_40_43]OFX89269.1 MAG: hypothetical protein A2W97_13355 [Bacteroidetes bacterium GWE2_40_63]OFY23894.1 MAG: hypothetical protein A2W88_11935 [Bacteroidetes bacterium GWF2_40_13]OFZ32268.1 MAG: hypothetical protein A2437_19855 [Bacteroidetes bacterium RIFOXYC2_FULL_40_12]HBO74599.1 hypothetical protein [Marinilabiliales bacterium]
MQPVATIKIKIKAENDPFIVLFLKQSQRCRINWIEPKYSTIYFLDGSNNSTGHSGRFKQKSVFETMENLQVSWIFKAWKWYPHECCGLGMTWQE